MKPLTSMVKCFFRARFYGRAGILVMLYMLPLSGYGQTPIGKILFVHGDAVVISEDGISRKAKKGNDVFLRDLVVTEKAASVQIQMQDKSYFAVRPDSSVRLARFSFNGQSKNNQVETKVFKGGLRSITGLIGQKNKKQFAISTPVATIGIRGTDLVVFHVADKIEEMENSPQGSYLLIQEGSGALENESGTQVLKPNEVAYASSAVDAPKPLEDLPDIFKQPTFEESLIGINSDRFTFSGQFYITGGRSDQLIPVAWDKQESIRLIPLFYHNARYQGLAYSGSSFKSHFKHLNADVRVNYHLSGYSYLFAELSALRQYVSPDNEGDANLGRLAGNRLSVGGYYGVSPEAKAWVQLDYLIANSDKADTGTEAILALEEYQIGQLQAGVDIKLNEQVAFSGQFTRAEVDWEFMPFTPTFQLDNAYRSNSLELGAHISAQSVPVKLYTGLIASHVHYDESGDLGEKIHGYGGRGRLDFRPVSPVNLSMDLLLMRLSPRFNDESDSGTMEYSDRLRQLTLGVQLDLDTNVQLSGSVSHRQLELESRSTFSGDLDAYSGQIGVKVMF